MNYCKLISVACCFCLITFMGVQAQNQSENNSKCKQNMGVTCKVT